MNGLLAFMAALKDNFNFVLLVFVVGAVIVFCTLTVVVQRTIRRKNRDEHNRALELQRCQTNARGIVQYKVDPTGGDLV